MKLSVSMTVVLLVLLIVPLSALALQSFLFIGNSHTDAHGMTATFAALAQAGGHDVHVDKSTVGGSTISYHTHYQPTLDKIHSRPWDRIIIQEHSLLPVIPYWRDAVFYPKAAMMDSIIQSVGSETVLYLHQARPFPEGEYCIEGHCSREFTDYFDMQQEMSSAYYPLAEDLAVQLVPVGDIWAESLGHDPDLPLWSSDDLHFSPEGAYFTACVFYVHLLDDSPVGITYYGGINPELALDLQRYAYQLASAGEDGPPGPLLGLACHPNPFNPATEIRFELPEPAVVSLGVHDLSGRLVADLMDEVRPEGRHSVTWNGRNRSGQPVPAGTYFIRVEARGVVESLKVVLVK